MRAKKVFLYSTSVIGIVTVILLVLYFGLNFSYASNEIIKEVKSPDGITNAVVFKRSAGATTSTSLEVSITFFNEKINNDIGNIFIIDHSNNIDVEWVNSKSLKIYYNVDEKYIDQKVVKFHGIEIEYVLKY